MKRIQLFTVLYDLNMRKLDGIKCDRCGILLYPPITVELCPQCIQEIAHNSNFTKDIENN